jgi:hypothetical protein
MAKTTALLAVLPLLAAAQDRTAWREHLGGADSSLYSSLKQINNSKLKQIQLV